MAELAPRGVLRVGDRIRFEGRNQQVIGLEGTALRLLSDEGDTGVMAAGYVMAAADFEVLDRGPEAVPERVLPPFALVDALPPAAAEQARFWEQHVVEVLTGLPPEAPEGMSPRPEYDPAWRNLMEREAAKVAELAAGGQQISKRTFLRMRQRYEAEGLWGLMDGRSRKPPAPVPGTGRVDERVVEAVTEALAGQTDLSTGDRKRLMLQAEQILAAKHGEEAVKLLPTRATFYRLVNSLAKNNESFGSATVRRQRALRPVGPFTPSMAARPGEIVQIDSTRLDVIAVLDDGVVARPELTIAVDVTTRTICAALLRPAGTKGVDAAVLLARMLVPEPMRPGWSQILAMSDSILPHQRLMAVDARLDKAAAKPVIVPDTIVIDHGKVFVSDTFSSACSLLGISLQLARPRTPTDKAIVERTFASINSLFCQYVAGYTGSDVTRRGSDPASEAVWTLAQLQDLLDEWTICWQQRPHEGLRNPYMAGRTLSPNESYAIAVARAGYLPVALSAEDYIELLPTVWRAVNDYGIKVNYRTYDSPELNRLRRQPSGVTGKQDLWEVHYDPYDVSRVWVRRSDNPGERLEFGYPLLRLVVLVECGTRAILAAAFGPESDGELTYAGRLLSALDRTMLLLADAGFDANTFARDVHATGAQFLVRSSARRVPTPAGHLADGSYLARIGYGVLSALLTVRVIEADVTFTLADGTVRHEQWRLLTSLLDATRYPATELIALYHERWQAETTYFSIKATMLDGRVLRSRSLSGLDQEVYALLTTYQALIRAAADTACTRPGLDMDRISFTVLLATAADTVTSATGILPPAGPIELAGTIGRAVLDALHPARRRHRVKARTRKNPTSKYGPNAGQHPTTSQNYAIHTTVTFFEHGLANRSRK